MQSNRSKYGSARRLVLRGAGMSVVMLGRTLGLGSVYPSCYKEKGGDWLDGVVQAPIRSGLCPTWEE